MSNNNIHTDPKRRHDFVLVFEVEMGNPNGDPDAGNLPRVDPETGHGIVTDVCLKRKVRDYLQMTKGVPIFIQCETALNTLIDNAAEKRGVDLKKSKIEDEELIEWLSENDLDGIDFEGEAVRIKDEFNLKTTNTAIEKYLKNGTLNEELKKKLLAQVKEWGKVAKKKLKPEDRKVTREELINEYYDIRLFGAVLSTGINAGQVRGPVQFTFAKSVDPIFRLDNSITRIAITKKADKKRKETEMARKPIVPYALYVAHGFYNPYFALEKKEKPDDPDKFKVSEGDLSNLWEALEWMFNNDTAAARGRMATRGLYVFSHDSKRGNEHSHKLFDRIKICLDDEKRQKDEPAERFCDYKITIDENGLRDEKKNKDKSITLQKLVDDINDCLERTKGNNMTDQKELPHMTREVK